MWIFRACSYKSVWKHRGLTYFACGDVDFFFFGVVLWSYLFVLGSWNWNWTQASINDAGLNWRKEDLLPNEMTKRRWCQNWEELYPSRMMAWINKTMIMRKYPLESGRWLDAGNGFFLLFWNSNENEHTQWEREREIVLYAKEEIWWVCVEVSSYVRTYVG